MTLTIKNTRWRRGVIISMALMVTQAIALPAFAASVPQPVIDTPEYGAHGVSAVPVIEGQLGAGTVAEVRIDGEVAGVATVVREETRSQFRFTPIEPLAPGYHALEVVGKDPAGILEQRYSYWWFIHVSDRVPAPVVYDIRQSTDGTLTVTGVVKSGNRVKVYVNGVAFLLSEVFTHPSGASGFQLALQGLGIGEHAIAIAAVDAEGVESRQTETKTVQVTKLAPAPSASPAAQNPSPASPATAGSVKGESNAGPQGDTSAGRTLAIEDLQPAAGVTADQLSTDEGKKESAPSVNDMKGNPPSAALLGGDGQSSTSTVMDADEGQDEDMQGATDEGTGQRNNQRIPLLIGLGVILIALIAWYATRDEEPPQGSRTGSEGKVRSSDSQGNNQQSQNTTNSPPPPPPIA